MKASKKSTQHDVNALEVWPVLVFIITGSFIRLVHVLPLRFPLNDGGFYYAIIRDLIESQQFFPTFVTYNHELIPFAYPPLAFYLTEMLSGIFGISVLAVIRVGPAVLSCFTLPLFYLAARKYLRSIPTAVCALAAYAFLPPAFDSMIVGGGLTRSLGWLFSIAAITLSRELYRKDGWVQLLLVSTLAAFTVLSHPGVAWFTVYSLGLIFLWEGGLRKENFPRTVAVVGFAALLSSPWWLTTIIRHGPLIFKQPFQTVTYSIPAVITPFTLLFTNEPFLNIIAWCGLLGIVLSIQSRDYLLITWAGAVFVLDPRLSATYAAVPFAMLAGRGYSRGILPMLDRDRRRIQGDPEPQAASPGFAAVGLSAFLAVYLMTAAYLAPGYHYLSAAQQEAFRWIRENTPGGSTFLVVTGNPDYGTDYVNEWFPALTERISLTTPQGTEWLPEREFNARVLAHRDLQACSRAGPECLEAWADQHGKDFDYIYIAAQSLQEQGILGQMLISELDGRSDYTSRYDRGEGLIYRKTE